jgi:hypothetical protein
MGTKKRLVVTLLTALLLSGGSRSAVAEDAGTKPPEVHAGGEISHNVKPKPRPRPKRPDKEKDCQYDRSEELSIDEKTITVTQETIRNIMSGREAEQDGYVFYADTVMLVFRVKDPDGNWFTANMTRLGSEGCIFYYIGQLVPHEGEPPL